MLVYPSPARPHYGRCEAYDEQPVPELDSEAIDCRAASESFLIRAARVRP